MMGLASYTCSVSDCRSGSEFCFFCHNLPPPPDMLVPYLMKHLMPDADTDPQDAKPCF